MSLLTEVSGMTSVRLLIWMRDGRGVHLLLSANVSDGGLMLSRFTGEYDEQVRLLPVDLAGVAEFVNRGFNTTDNDVFLELLPLSPALTEKVGPVLQVQIPMPKAGMDLDGLRCVPLWYGPNKETNNLNERQSELLQEILQEIKPRHAVVFGPRLSMYLERKGGLCPYCLSSDIQGESSVDVDGPMGQQEVSCNACEGTWYDVYKLDDVSTDELPPEGTYE